MPEIRPIDGNALLSKAEVAPMYAVDAMVCYDLIKSAPTLDIVPVIHAHWIKSDCDSCDFWCSECGFEDCEDMSLYLYCPHCGAKMDGKE